MSQLNRRGRVSQLLHGIFLLTFCVPYIITESLDYSSHIFTFAHISCQLPVSSKHGPSLLRVCNQHTPILHLWTLFFYQDGYLDFMHVCRHAMHMFYIFTFRHFHWGTVILYIIRLPKLFTQLSSNVTTQTAQWEKCFVFSQAIFDVMLLWILCVTHW